MRQKRLSKQVGIGVMLTIALAALFAALAFAAPGERDRGFGRNGIAGASLGPHYLETRFMAVAEAGDGGILVSRDGTAERYSALGVRDTSFPDQPFPSPPVRAIQSDGKVLVRGENGGVKRLLADGSPDPSFHGGESEALPALYWKAIAVSDSGQIFVGGTNVYATGTKGCFCQLAVAHVNPDGTLDKGFGGDGLAGLYTDLKIDGPEGWTALEGLAPQGDGGVVLVAADSVLKLTSTGTLDTAYGKDGEVTSKPKTVVGFRTLPGDVLELAGTIDAQPTEDGGNDFFVARYGSAGRPDPAFAGGAGIATIDFGGDERASTAWFGDDGSILLGGSTAIISKGCVAAGSCGSTPALARFTGAGIPDGSFGDGGRVRIEALRGASGGSGGVLALLVRGNGDIVAVGSAGPSSSVAFIAALDPGGALQPGFGQGGLVTELRTRPSEQLGDPAVEIDPGRRIYAAVSNSAGAGDAGPSVIRYLPDGRLDHSFGEEPGYVRSAAGEDATALAIDRAGGSVLLTNPNQVYRFTPDGRVDPRFAAGERVLLRAAPAHFRDVAIQPDGRILVAGTSSWLGERGRMLVARLLPSGRLDPSFGRHGYAAVGCKWRSQCRAVRVVVRHDGRILLAGGATHQGGIGRYNEEPSRIAVAQLLPNGQPDPSFGAEGFLTLRLGDYSLGTSLALSRGQILVGGLTQTRRGIRGVIARLQPDGRVDRGFANHGFLRAFPKSVGVPSEVFPSKGRLIVVTRAVGNGNPPSRSVLGFRANGRPDRSYRRLSTEGLMPRLVSGPGAALQGGRIVLAWTQINKPKGGGEGSISLRLTRLSR
jgi:uncharacterized delta-60 repeat protein